MNRILVIGDLLIDRYRFLKPLRSDPANKVALVVESIREEQVDGGAGNLAQNIKSLCGEEPYFYYSGERFPTKIRYYIEDRFILREDRDDIISHDEEVIKNLRDDIESEDFVIISDYHKGTLERADIVKIIERCKKVKNVTVFVDTNYVYPEHENVDWLKINLKTAKECVDNFSKDTAEKISQMNNSNVIITQGEEGFTAYLKDSKTTVVFTKDKNEDCIDAIGAGDTFLAGFVSYLVKHDDADLPALIYADIVAHLSTQQLGTIDVVDVDKADAEYKNAKTSIEECKDTLYVHRTIVND